MTPELLALARGVDRLWRCSGVRGRYGFKREQAARIGLLQPDRLARLLADLDASDVHKNFSFLSLLDDAIRDPCRVPSLHEYLWRRGVTEEVAAKMIDDRRAGRPVGLPPWEPKPGAVLRMAAFLESVRPGIEEEAQVARGVAAAKEEAERMAKFDAETEAALEIDGEESRLAELGS